MLEQLLQGLQGQVGQEVQEKAGVDSDMMSKIMKIAGGVASQQVAKQITSGGISDVMNLFSNQPNNSNANALQSNISNDLVSNLIEKLGLDKEKAAMISSLVIPAVMNMVTQKNSETPDTDSSPITDLFGGNKAGLVKGLLGKFFK